MTYSLPRNDPDTASRAEQLRWQRSAYTYDHAFLPGTGLAERFPIQQAPPFDYAPRRAVAQARVDANALAVRLRQDAPLFGDPFDALDDYAAEFQLLPRPAIVDTWREDVAFAEQRVAGANPCWLRAVKTDADLADMGVTDAHVAEALGAGHGLASLRAAGRLMVADYTVLDGVPDVANAAGTKFGVAPRALFAAVEGAPTNVTNLVPLCIQVQRVFHPVNNPVFTPRSSHWLQARMAVQNADLVVHEVGTHLWGTHLVLEPVIIGAWRNMAENHPVLVMMQRHFHVVLANNYLAKQVLLPTAINNLFPGGMDGALKTLVKLRDAYDWSTAGVSSGCRARGTTADILPHHPWRDDGERIWADIRAYVHACLLPFYPSDGDVTGDVEVQAFLADVASSGGGNLRAFPSTARDLDALVDVVTQVIFTSSAQHAAVNFPQADHFTFIPNQPAALYARPVPPDAVSADLMRLLPGKEMTAEQVKTASELALFRYDRLGHFRDHLGLPTAFDDGRMEAAVEDFKARLDITEQELRARNAHRRFSYPYLYPSNIPNSSSV